MQDCCDPNFMIQKAPGQYAIRAVPDFSVMFDQLFWTVITELTHTVIGLFSLVLSKPLIECPDQNERTLAIIWLS
jgi:hypothetical protein